MKEKNNEAICSCLIDPLFFKHHQPGGFSNKPPIPRHVNVSRSEAKEEMAHGLGSNACPQIVMSGFGNSGMDGDPQDEGSFLPVNVIPHGDDNAQEQREWGYT